VGVHEEAHKGVEELGKKKSAFLVWRVSSSSNLCFYFKSLFNFFLSFLSSSKGTRWKDISLGKLRILQKRQITRGTRRNQILESFPPIVISILDKEKGGTPKNSWPIITYKYVIIKSGKVPFPFLTSQIYMLRGFVPNPCEICYFMGSYCLNMNVMHCLNTKVMCRTFVCKQYG